VLELPLPQLDPTAIQTIKLCAHTRWGTKVLEFVKVLELDSMIPNGPYLALANEWSPYATAQERIKLYHIPPSDQGIKLYRLSSDEQEVDMTSNAFFFPHAPLIPLPAKTTTKDLAAALQATMQDPQVKEYDQIITTMKDQRIKLERAIDKVTSTRDTLVNRCIVTLLTGRAPPQGIV